MNKNIICVASFFLCTTLCSQSVIEDIKNKARTTHSDALIIVKNGKVIVKDLYGKGEQPIYIASAGKSLASLAIGKLIDQKLLDSLDQPVYTIYPEWKQGRKKDITVRMLLNHTSGIQNHPNASIELEPAPDYKVDNIIKLALAAELTDIPGQKISYNNKAVALLGGIVSKLSGKSFDEFYVEEFFNPMNIKHYDWIKDKSGNPTVHGAFKIKPSDFIKFGELILNKGRYNGKQILSEKWIEQSLKQSQEFTPIWGLLWWRLPEFEHRIIDDQLWEKWEKAGVSKQVLEKLTPLKNTLFKSKEAYNSEMRDTFGQDWYRQLNSEIPANLDFSTKIYGEKITAYYADGFRGNFLVIVPEKNIVAIRCADSDEFNYETDFFSEFPKLISTLN